MEHLASSGVENSVLGPAPTIGNIYLLRSQALSVDKVLRGTARLAGKTVKIIATEEKLLLEHCWLRLAQNARIRVSKTKHAKPLIL